ncbi:MAG: M48 family metallopeptidase [Myxococcales bacterium]|nr:M48 family metallopeptidase [Myxococcales bacterium]MDH3484878.1 M48 family metallopeptidase [Myxococcales bacterium]
MPAVTLYEVVELDAARSLFPLWLVWAPLLLNLSAAAVVSFLAVRLAVLPTPRQAWSTETMHWSERARALYPSRRATRALKLIAPVVFAVICWSAAGELLPLSRWAMGLAGFVTSYASVHAAGFLNERRIRPGLTVAQYARTVLFTLFVLVWLLLPGALVFALAGEELNTRWVVACLIGLVVAMAMQRLGVLRAAAFVRLAGDADERLRGIMERASQKAGIHPKWVGILPLPLANAFAQPIHRQVVFTSGALEAMDDGEIEAIALHELGHLDQARSFEQARTIGTVLLLTLGGSRPVFAELGLTGFLPLMALVFVIALWSGRRQRRGEESADRHAHEHVEDPAEYAMALEKIYEINLVPAVLGHKLATHPDLYDRQQAVGYTPTYARPDRPSGMRKLVAMLIPVSFIFVSLLATWVAVPMWLDDEIRTPATSFWIVRSPGGRELFFSAWAAHTTAPDDAQTLLKATLASQDARKPAFLGFADQYAGVVPCAIARPLRAGLSLRFGETSTKHFERCPEDEIPVGISP